MSDDVPYESLFYAVDVKYSSFANNTAHRGGVFSIVYGDFYMTQS